MTNVYSNTLSIHDNAALNVKNIDHTTRKLRWLSGIIDFLA